MDATISSGSEPEDMEEEMESDEDLIVEERDGNEQVRGVKHLNSGPLA